MKFDIAIYDFPDFSKNLKKLMYLENPRGPNCFSGHKVPLALSTAYVL